MWVKWGQGWGGVLTTRMVPRFERLSGSNEESGCGCCLEPTRPGGRASGLFHDGPDRVAHKRYRTVNAKVEIPLPIPWVHGHGSYRDLDVLTWWEGQVHGVALGVVHGEVHGVGERGR